MLKEEGCVVFSISAPKRGRVTADKITEQAGWVAPYRLTHSETNNPLPMVQGRVLWDAVALGPCDSKGTVSADVRHQSPRGSRPYFCISELTDFFTEQALNLQGER